MPTYEYNVAMTCGGCSGAVERLLKKKGDDLKVTNFEIKLEERKVFVTVADGGASAEEVMELVAKCKKETSFVGSV